MMRSCFAQNGGGLRRVGCVFTWGNVLIAMNMIDPQRAGGIIWKTSFLIGGGRHSIVEMAEIIFLIF